ncbi:hypothetical protein Bbelb_253720 [Branchiostoma belcheri]|nr:hypothetical protein Bbelb_253720 [Branchiostoma belcheri]
MATYSYWDRSKATTMERDLVGAYGPTSQTCEKNPTLRDWFYSQLSAAVDIYPSQSLFYLAGISIPSWEQAKLDKNTSPHGGPASRLTTTELYEIDFVLGRIKQRRTVTQARAYHVPEISTDHCMVVATICSPQKVWFSNTSTRTKAIRLEEIRNDKDKQEQWRSVVSAAHEPTSWDEAASMLVEQGRKILGTEQRSKRTQTYFTDNPQVAQMSKQQNDLRHHIQLKRGIVTRATQDRVKNLTVQRRKVQHEQETVKRSLNRRTKANIISKRFESLFNIDAAPLPPFQAAPLRKPVTASEVARHEERTQLWGRRRRKGTFEQKALAKERETPRRSSGLTDETKLYFQQNIKPETYALRWLRDQARHKEKWNGLYKNI